MKSQFYLIFTAIFIFSFLAIFSLVYKQDYVKNYLEEKEVAENFYRENLILFSNFGKEYAIDFSKEFFKIYSLRKNFKFLNVYIQASNVLNITILNFLKSSTVKICSDKECYQKFIEFGKTYDFSLNYSSNYLEIYFENFYKRINISEVTFLSIYKTLETFYSFSLSNITKKILKPIACLVGFRYRIPILINNTHNSNNLTDYQILVTLNTQSLISQGKMRNDCGDIRFTDSDRITILNYWLESGCNTQNTRIWVKVNISANSSKIIYLYYGNPSATSLSNATTTFDYFFSFEGSFDGWTPSKYETRTTYATNNPTITTEWKYDGSYSVKLRIGDDYSDVGAYSQINRTFSFSTNVKLDFAYRLYATVGYDGGDKAKFIVLIDDNVVYDSGQFGTSGWDSGTLFNSLSAGSGSHTITFKLIETASYGGWTDGRYAYIDRVSIRKYTSPEPTISLGNEEVC